MTQPVSRTARQARILELLETTRVSSQVQLSELLLDEGIDITQATLSRDLDELGAKKVRPRAGGRPAAGPPATLDFRCGRRLDRPATSAAPAGQDAAFNPPDRRGPTP